MNEFDIHKIKSAYVAWLNSERKADWDVAWDHVLSLLTLYVSHGKRDFPSRAKEAKKQKKEKK